MHWPLEDDERYLDGPPEFPESFYGFEHVDLARGMPLSAA